MSVRPLHTIPISEFRSHTKFCLRRVSWEMDHLMLTYRGKARAAVIPMQDARVLWQLQGRPLREMEDRIEATHARWRSAKSFAQAWEDGVIDEGKWRDWSGFERM